jgi:hypothetical protein
MNVKDLKQQLIEEIASENEALAKMELGTETYKVTTEGIGKLYDRLIELERMENEALSKCDEHVLKEAELKMEKRDKLIKNILQGAAIGVTATLALVAHVSQSVFEYTGKFPSTTIGKKAQDFMLKIFKG